MFNPESGSSNQQTPSPDQKSSLPQPNPYILAACVVFDKVWKEQLKLHLNNNNKSPEEEVIEMPSQEIKQNEQGVSEQETDDQNFLVPVDPYVKRALGIKETKRIAAEMEACPPTGVRNTELPCYGSPRE